MNIELRYVCFKYIKLLLLIQHRFKVKYGHFLRHPVYTLHSVHPIVQGNQN